MPYYPNREQLAWAAGFFDGEGCVLKTYENPPRKDGRQAAAIQVSIGQSGIYGHELLRRFAIAVGLPGNLYGPRPPAKNQKLVRYQWEVNGFEKVQAVAAMLWPWLGRVKRAQFGKILAAYHAGRRRR